MPKWPKDMTCKFVTEYVSHECLWNTSLPAYKKKHSRVRALDEIGKAMGIAGFGRRQVAKKIKNIRSTYLQEVNKIKDSERSGDPDDIYIPCIPWFQLVDDALKSGTSPVTKIKQTDFITDSFEIYGDEEIEAKEEVPRPNTTFKPAIVRTSSASPVKKRKVEKLKDVYSQLQGINETFSDNIEEESEFDLFGRLVSRQLKSLPLPLALQSQQHIQTYLSQVRLEHLHEIQNMGAGNTDHYLVESPSSSVSYNSNR